MRQIIFIIGLLWFFNQISFSQMKSKKVDLLLGVEKKESTKSTLSGIVGYDKSGIYNIMTKKNNFGYTSTIILEHFDNKLSQTKSVELDLKYQKKDLSFEFVIQLNDELFLFSSFKNIKLKRNFLFVQSINKETLQFNQDIKKVAEIDYSGHSKYNAGDFNYRISRDSSKVLIYYELPYEKGANERFGFHVFDGDLNQLWEKNITLPYKEELFRVENYKIDNKGNVHLLGMIFYDNRRASSNYNYQILSYINNGDELKEYPVKIEERFFNDMQIAINDDEDIICCGFYSDVYKKNHSDVGYFSGSDVVSGTYFIKIDSNTKEIIVQQFKQFVLDFITQNMSERQKSKVEEKAEKGEGISLNQYDLKDIIIKDDGGAILTGEQYYLKINESSYTDSQGRTQKTRSSHYYYNDIIVINISPTGNIEWAEKIAKRQYTVNDRGIYSSFALSIVNDKLYFVFNDHLDNLLYKGEGNAATFNKGRGSIVVLVEVDSEGNQTREALFSLKEADVLTQPEICEQVSENEMIIFGQRKKTRRFAKITFKDYQKNI